MQDEVAVPIEEIQQALAEPIEEEELVEESEMGRDDVSLVRLATPEEVAIVTQKPETPDFIDTYAEYADVLEAPREMHEAVAIQLLATVLNRNGVSIPLGGLKYSLDLWTVLLSGSGLGRTTLVGLAHPILKKANLEDILLNTRWGSLQALYQQFAERPDGLFIWGELSEKLKLLNDRSFAGAKQWLTDRYDNWRSPDNISYRATGKVNQDTPPITFPRAPRFNILATSSEEWFFRNLWQEDSAGGFVPRWLLIRAKDSGRVVPIPRQLDQEVAETLAIQLLCVSDLKGQADLSGILNPYDRWYRETKRRFQSQADKALASVYFNRHRVHVLKLAVVYEVSSTLSLKVTKDSWERAVRAASLLEETIFSLLPTGMSAEGYRLLKVEERIRSAGPRGMAWSELTRAFQHDDSRKRHERINTLLEAQRVYSFHHKTPGRTAQTLVHADFVSEYAAAHAKDDPLHMR